MLTRAYINFRFSIRKTETILKLGISGISEEKTRVSVLLQKLDSPEPVTSDEERQIRLGKIKTENGQTLFRLRFTADELKVVRDAVGHVLKQTGDLSFHLHGILLVAIWGSFETYIQGMLSEIYIKHPDRLASDRSLTIKQVVEARDDVIGFLIDQEIAHLGALHLADVFRYLKSKVLFDFSETRRSELMELYFLRNVFAHNTGFVRAGQTHLVPSEIEVIDDQIKIPHSYLLSAVERVEASVDELERYILKRWFDTNVDESDPYEAYIRLRGLPLPKLLSE
jgi:hypothetical protein